MLTVGLTGGIGSGKSTVASLFAEKGVPIIDTDIIAKRLLTKDVQVFEAVVTHLRLPISCPSQLNRAKLRKRIFENSAEKRWLEALLHPKVLKQVVLEQKALKATYCIVVIPLLAEVAAARALVERVLLVDVSVRKQIDRVMQRDACTQDRVQKILAQQATRVQRLHIADDVLDNNSDMRYLQVGVARLHQKYGSIARK